MKSFVLSLGMILPLLASGIQSFDMPLRFEPNRGQAPASTLFLSRGKGFTVEAQISGLRFVGPGGVPVEMRFHGAETPKSVSGSTQQPSVSNYFQGADPKLWLRDIPNFAAVEYKDLYPGIGLKLHQQPGARLEYDFLIDPGADPSLVQLEFTGASRLEIDKSGDLLIHTKSGVLRQQKPKLYQGDKLVQGRFVKKSAYRIGFAVGPYNRSKQLVIDPVIVYSTYIGGNQDDQINAMALNADGSVIVAGAMKSTNFPRRDGLYNSNDSSGSFDMFVVKLNSAGTGILFTTVIGGNRDDVAQAVAIDASGNIYVAGTTTSLDLPTTAGAFQKTNSGGAFTSETEFRGDAFLLKLDATGSTLLASTYLGGTQGEVLKGMILDKDQSPVLFGYSFSANFPVTNDAYQKVNVGNSDGFITKFNASATAQVYSTFFGGNGADRIVAMTTDKDGNFYLAGDTSSNNFPVSSNAPQKTLAGNSDLFATKFSNSWSLVYSTYYGGSGTEIATAIAVDSTGGAWIAGTTTNNFFPVISASSIQDTFSGGNTDGCFFSLDAAGGKVKTASFFGGERQEENVKIAFHPDGSVLLLATTDSTKFPITRDAFALSSGARDILLVKLPADLSELKYSTYFGGANNDYLNAFIVDSAGAYYLAGTTDSQFFPTTKAAFQPISQGGTDGFVFKIGSELPSLLNSPISPIQAALGGPAVSTEFTLTSSGAPLEFRISFTSSGNWLSVTPVLGVTPATVRVTVDPSSLALGNYTGRVTVATQGAVTNSVVFVIPLVVSGSITSVGPVLFTGGIVNGASFKAGPVSPGEIITIFGAGIGPGELAGAQLTSAGTVSKFIGNTRILFDGIAAPLIYVSANQSAAIAPYFLSNRPSTSIEVEYNGIRSKAAAVPTSASSPALFTIDSSGSGLAAALNEDGSVNAQAKPAKKGGIIILFATGEGQTTPDGGDGQLAGSILPKPRLPVAVSIGGKDAEVLYAGAAPGLVAGVMQVNVRVPSNADSGENAVVLTVGTAASPQGVTIAVQ